ncbi:MAG: acylneuraminate cytidylyltransferase family protein [Anaerolineae bacterium]|nr:acylneuraminate cytidylyltransferase family protein [Phycisphaerae bacterium]
MNVLAVIIARAGSAGLKNKHLLPLLGKPVIQYTFDHARASRYVTRAVVSTDSTDVRKLAEREFFETVARPGELSTADASVQDVLLHALKTVEDRSDFRADAIALLYGNVPVRDDTVIDRAIDVLRDTHCDSVRSFCPVGKWHPSWMAKIEGDANDRVIPLQQASIHRRQDLTPLYLHDGAIVAMSRKSLLRGEQFPDDPHAFFGVDRRAIMTGVGETVEIDHQRDLYWAEAVLRERAGSPREGMAELTRMAS